MTSVSTIKPHYSVLIIGAGINGCGTFRDLSLQGVDCLLIDRGDICSGASSAPSRLIHGGLKYLETNEFRLVKESAMERNRLLRNAPHYVKALEVLFPTNTWFAGLVPAILGYLGFNARIKERGALLIEIGLRIYDFYSRKVQVLPDHRFFNKSVLQQDYPHLPKDIVAAGMYHEGRVTHAERLGLEVIQDGLDSNTESTLATYTFVKSARDGKLMLQDAITGETRTVTADIILNAGGAWIDKINAALGINSRYMGGSKGSHLIVKHEALMRALNGRMMYFGCKDGRFNLIYPFFGNALVGSTDLSQPDADEARTTAEETDYLLGVVSEVFPTIKLTRDDVVLTYCGVRPLPAAKGKDIGDVSRDHSIERDRLPGTDVPVLSLVGGKWTTFRAFSEQTCDAVLALLRKTRTVSTVDRTIGGGRNYPHDVDTFCKSLAPLSQVRAHVLFDRYGTLASTMAQTDVKPLRSMPNYTEGELAHICLHEHVRRLADLLLRRTSATMEGLLSVQAIEETARIAASVLDWDGKRMAAEIEHAKSELARRSVANVRPA